MEILHVCEKEIEALFPHVFLCAISFVLNLRFDYTQLAHLQQKRVDPFCERLLLDVKTFLLQGLDAALLELENVLSLSHSLLYLRTAPVSIDSRWRI